MTPADRIARLEKALAECKEKAYWAIQGPRGDGTKTYQRDTLMAAHSKIIRIATTALQDKGKEAP